MIRSTSPWASKRSTIADSERLQTNAKALAQALRQHPDPKALRRGEELTDQAEAGDAEPHAPQGLSEATLEGIGQGPHL